MQGTSPCVILFAYLPPFLESCDCYFFKHCMLLISFLKVYAATLTCYILLWLLRYKTQLYPQPEKQTLFPCPVQCSEHKACSGLPRGTDANERTVGNIKEWGKKETWSMLKLCSILLICDSEPATLNCMVFLRIKVCWNQRTYFRG